MESHLQLFAPGCHHRRNTGTIDALDLEYDYPHERLQRNNGHILYVERNQGNLILFFFHYVFIEFLREFTSQMIIFLHHGMDMDDIELKMEHKLHAHDRKIYTGYVSFDNDHHVTFFLLYIL